MARAGAFGGGTLSPFGGATTDFGAFNVGEDAAAAKTVNAQEAANLQFAISREQHDAGLMTDAEFASIQAGYLSALDPKTVSGATAQYTIQMTQYTNDRNALAQAVQMGQADPEQLVDFDRAALGQTVPGSTEYMQRQDRLWTSQGMVFQQAETQVLDNLNEGRITNLQAQEWYKQQAVLFSDNYQIQTDISGKINQFADRIVAEGDKGMADGWNKGNLTIAQVIAYTSQAAAADPGGSRAQELQQFARDARLQAQESSMKYRYDLTREYEQLAKLVAQSAPSTGGTSTSTTTRTLWDGTKWVTQTSTSTKANAPTKAMVEANAQRLKDIANAKERMAQIKTTVSNIAGGWVSDQDYIRNLTAQQSSMAKGSPGWYALQQQIDGYQQRIEQDKMDAALGLKVAYPRVASELTADLTAGIGGEVPVGTGLSNAQLKQVQGWNAAITKLQESIATGMLTEEQAKQATADIAKNKSYIAGALKATTAPKVAVAPAAKGGATSGGGGTVAARTSGSATSIGTAKSNGGTFVTAGPLLKVVSDRVVTQPVAGPAIFAGGKVYEPGVAGTKERSVTTKATGLPVGMSPSAFDDFHSAFISAIKAGKPSFQDKTTGAVYAIPTDPQARLEMMRYVDDTNVALKYEGVRAAMANPKASQSYVDGKKSSLGTAQQYATSNLLWVLNTSDAGTVIDEDTGRAIKLGSNALVTNKPNSLAYGVDLIDVTIAHAQQHFDIAQAYYDRGDYTAAAAEISQGRAGIAAVSIGPDGKTAKGSLLSIYAQQAASMVAQATDLGGKVDSTILTDLKRLNNFGVELQEPSKKIDKTATALFGPEGKEGTGILAMANGYVLPDPSGREAALNNGWMRFVNEDGTVTAKKVKATGNENGKPTYAQKGRVTVMVNTGSSSVPMSAAYETGTVGEMLIDGLPVAITGKIVTVGDEVWMESPFRPGMWIPMDGSSTTRFSAPKGAKAGVNPPGVSNIPGLAAGATFITFSKNGTQYLLSPNEDGGMDLYENGFQGAVLIGTGGTAAGTSDQNYQNIVNGFGYDSTTLSPEQRAIVNLVTTGKDKSAGAWIGSSAQDIADFLLRSGDVSSVNPSPYVGFNLNQPTYAPRVISTGDEPAAVGVATIYEPTYVAKAITAPPSSTPKVAPITTVTSPAGVTKTVSTGKVATPVTKPALYETNPTPAPKSPVVNKNVGVVIKPAPVPSGEKATVIPKSGPVAK
jgi:hypothetical protein